MLDQPAITRERYVTSGAPQTLPMTIASPAAGATTPGSSTAVSGTTAPGAGVAVASSQPGSAPNTTTVVQTTADPSGHFSVTVPTPSGTNVITAAAAKGPHASGWAQEQVTGS